MAKSSLLDAAERDDAGGVHQPVEPAVPALDLGRDALPVGFRGHVERDVLHPARSEAIAVPPARESADDHGCADSARSAGDQNNLIVEIDHAR